MSYFTNIPNHAKLTTKELSKDLNLDPKKILTAVVRSSSRKVFDIGQYYVVMNSPELPYYYRTITVILPYYYRTITVLLPY